MKEIILDMKQKNFFQKCKCRQDFNGLLNYGSTSGTFYACAQQTFENNLTYEKNYLNEQFLFLSKEFLLRLQVTL